LTCFKNRIATKPMVQTVESTLSVHVRQQHSSLLYYLRLLNTAERLKDKIDVGYATRVHSLFELVAGSTLSTITGLLYTPFWDQCGFKVFTVVFETSYYLYHYGSL